MSSNCRNHRFSAHSSKSNEFGVKFVLINHEHLIRYYSVWIETDGRFSIRSAMFQPLFMDTIWCIGKENQKIFFSLTIPIMNLFINWSSWIMSIRLIRSRSKAMKIDEIYYWNCCKIKWSMKNHIFSFGLILFLGAVNCHLPCDGYSWEEFRFNIKQSPFPLPFSLGIEWSWDDLSLPAIT